MMWIKDIFGAPPQHPSPSSPNPFFSLRSSTETMYSTPDDCFSAASSPGADSAFNTFGLSSTAPPSFVDWRVSSNQAAIARSEQFLNQTDDTPMFDAHAHMRLGHSLHVPPSNTFERRGSAPGLSASPPNLASTVSSNSNSGGSGVLRRSPMHSGTRSLNRSRSALVLARHMPTESANSPGVNSASRVAARLSCSQGAVAQFSNQPHTQLQSAPHATPSSGPFVHMAQPLPRRDENPAKKLRSRPSSLGLEVAGLEAFGSLFGGNAVVSNGDSTGRSGNEDEEDLDYEDDFDDVGSESSFTSVTSVGMSALSIEQHPDTSFVITSSPAKRSFVRRRPSDPTLRLSANEPTKLVRNALYVPASSPPLSATMAIGCSMTEATHALFVSESAGTGERSKNFIIPAQPKEKQRKSYKNENRYLAPNPLSVHYVGEAPAPNAVVEVMLADESGRPLEYARQIELIGERTRTLGADGSAGFSLKMHDTSRGEWIRLLFVVRYVVDAEKPAQPNEWLFTARFRVDTNIRKVAE